MQLTPFDLNTWPRRDIYEFFSALRNPFYMVTFRQDVTALRAQHGQVVQVPRADGAEADEQGGEHMGSSPLFL